MSDEKDTSEDKQAGTSERLQAKQQQEKLKEKLKDMGVMQDEHVSPVKNKPAFFNRMLLVVMAAVVVAAGFWWWYTNNEQTTNTVADTGTSQAVTPYSLPGAPSSGNYPPADYPPPGPYSYGPVPPPMPMYPPPPEGNVNEPASEVFGNGHPDSRAYPGGRLDDRFGPPPGWGPYGPPRAPAYYGPPPRYYGQPHRQPYYRPAPYYVNPYTGGYYGPPPHGYMPGY